MGGQNNSAYNDNVQSRCHKALLLHVYTAAIHDLGTIYLTLAAFSVQETMRGHLAKEFGLNMSSCKTAECFETPFQQQFYRLPKIILLPQRA